MALINCPYCDKNISDEAVKCPHCKKKIKKSKLVLPVVIIVIIIIACVGGYLGWNQYQIIQAEKRQKEIDSFLTQIDELYAEFDSDGIEKCYDALDKLQYDTSKQREILDYDRSVYEDAYAYYVAINNVDSKLHKGEYASLRILIDTLKRPTEKFNALELNSDSEIGKYISGVRNNPMYSLFNSEFVNNTEYNLDYGLTSWGFEFVIMTYTEQLVLEKFPYIQ